MKKKIQIAVLGANPSWQKTLFFNDFCPGKINRAAREENYSSGKGINFCRAVRCSGLADTQLFQFAGGVNGKRLCEGLDASGFPHTTIRVAAETRNCITCLDRFGNMSELIGVSHSISPEECNEMLAALNDYLPQCQILAITGSLPDGTAPDLYIDAVKMSLKYEILVLIDALAGVREILELPGKIILKVNREEFLKIMNADEIVSAHRQAAQRYPGKIFAVTNGADEATLSNDHELYYYHLPVIEVVSPLGAGDTASAVMSALYASGVSEFDAFKYALASASANCLTATAGDFSLEASENIAARITYSREHL